MTNVIITNITFELNEYGQEFKFTRNGNWHSALLQLPNTPDSINRINGEEWEDDEEKDALFELLRDYFYAQFKSVEHAKASVEACFEVTHLIEVDNFYVAFSANKAVILKEGRLSDYYGVFYFEEPDPCLFYDKSQSAIIKEATEELFYVLSEALRKRIEDYAKNVNFYSMSEDVINQCFSDVVHEFMVHEFGTRHYDSCDISGVFYSDYACDIRSEMVGEVFKMGSSAE